MTDADELLPMTAYSLSFHWNGKVNVMASKKFSSKRLADYVEKLAAGFTVLGFGGGWVSSQVSASEAVLVVGGGVMLALIACILDQNSKENGDGM